MKLNTEFVKLPLTFDAERLALEVSQFEDSQWKAHPQGYPGNTALSLISVGGDPDNDETKGPMLPTAFLNQCPYLRQVLFAFDTVWGRTRLMRLDGNAEATPHADTNYYWMQRVRVHVPIITTPEVEFLCGSKSVNMAAGESWIFSTWSVHNVINPNPTRRIHLVADTPGSGSFWEMVGNAERMERKHIAYDPATTRNVATEIVNHPLIMSPWEQQSMIDLILADLPAEITPASRRLRTSLRRLAADWRAAWARFGANPQSGQLYRELLDRLEAELKQIEGQLRLGNGVDSVEMTRQIVVRPAVNIDTEKRGGRRAATRTRRLDRPIFIVCSPRSGSSLFFETMAQSPSLWTIGGESHGLIEGIPKLHPKAHRFHSNRLTAEDADPQTANQLERTFLANLRNRDGQPPAADATGLRMLEKTPKNSLRVPFLAAAFPDALFLYLYRDMRDTISSMLDAWRSGKFITYPDLPEWEVPPWSLLLTPGWRELSGKPLAEIVAAQWSTATRYLLDDLDDLPPDRWAVAGYDALITDPQKEMERLARFVDIEWDRVLSAPLPLSKTTLTPPEKEKWKRNADDLDIALPLVAEVAERARALFAHPPEAEPARKKSTPSQSVAPPTPAAPTGLQAPSNPLAPDAFRSVHTGNIPFILEQLGISILVSTYQSGRIISIRADEAMLNTHFRALPSPMGIAIGPRAMAIGVKNRIWEYQNQPAITARLEPKGKFDACFVPRRSHVTGDIRVHEVAYVNDELWVVNTRFSTLCTIDANHSFVPRWRPRFITKLAAEDRCHLNGFAIIDNRIRFVTALGETDVAAGWRENKAAGGILMDVASNEIVSRGLSMPHSPRWYDGKLWVLESGKGTLSVVDLASGRVETVTEVPGFTRGLAFAGPFAFIGLSQVRESNIFGGIPIAEKPDRACGLWVVDIRTGKIAGFLRFEGFVQEIFDIQILRGIRFPEIVEPESELVDTSYVVPTQALADVVVH